MVRTGRWANALVATHLVHTPTTGGGAQSPGVKLDHSSVVGRPIRKPLVTGMPVVTMTHELRGTTNTTLGPLYDERTCVGGLVDTWTSVQRTPAWPGAKR